ncbi:MAG: D-alanyl-D-alanine carboxypeptidase [Nitrosomonadales bacterium]|nr:D-alanyl-D-alanine carboxypeptidase [Nitrosomonadales bacterium]
MRVLLSILLLLCFPVQAALLAPVPALTLDAKAYLLYDFSGNQILLNQNGHERMEPASLTKLMTAYLIFSAINQNKLALTQAVTPSAGAILPQGEESRMFLETIKPVTIAELLRGLIVQSGNDAARVLAETLDGSEALFAERMNKEAARLGMKNTHFVNATGMPQAQHYSSAYDMAILAGAIVRDFPDHYPLYSIREFQYNSITQPNRNRLLWMDPFVDGLKTGHTNSAGFCLVASAKRGQRRLISVVLGTNSDVLRATESQKLLNYGFQFFDSVPLYAKDQAVSSIRIWKGTEKMLPVGFRQDTAISIPHGQQAELKAVVETAHPLIAPISVGQRVGTLKLTLSGKPYMEYPLVALEPVALANVFSRGWDSIRLLFQ